MKTYTLSQSGLQKIRRQFIRRVSIFLAVVLALVVAFSLWNAGNNPLIRFGISLIVFAFVVVIVFTRGVKQTEQVWESIKVELGKDYIARSQVNISPVRIQRNEVTAIEEIENGLCIRTSNKVRTLLIPNQLDEADYQEIKSRLAAWQPIQTKSTQTQTAILLAVLLIGFVILIASPWLWLVLLVGVAMSGYYGYLYWTTRKAEGTSSQFRRSMLVSFLFPIFITTLKAFFLTDAYVVFLRAALGR